MDADTKKKIIEEYAIAPGDTGSPDVQIALLTKRIALPHDLWFHAAHVPGSHVILRSPDGKPAPVPPALVELAAGVAAWLSKLRAQGVAEVHVAEKRNVRKPRKAPPGSVVLDHARTLRVKPVPPPR